MKLKFYGFDFDDNLAEVESSIYMKTKNGKEIPIPTYELPEVDKQLETVGSVIDKTSGELIIGLSDTSPFRDFNDSIESSEKFLLQATQSIKKGNTRVSWCDFVECVNNGSIFSIITMRGHRHRVFKRLFDNLIRNCIGGLNVNSAIKGLNHFKNLTQEPKQIDLLSYYLSELCQYYPVSFGAPNGYVENQQLAKLLAFEDFILKIREFSKKLKVNDVDIHLGFSDDNLKNVEGMIEGTSGKHDDITFHYYYTGNGVKEKL